MRAVAAALALAAFACGGSPASGGDGWPGRTHARAGDEPPPSPREARGRLDAALAGEDARAVAVAADAWIAAGGTLRGRERARVFAALDRIPVRELGAAWRAMSGRGAVSAAAALRAALWARHRGDAAGALAWIDRVRGDAELERRGAEVKDAILARREVDPTRVAVLLPLSGRFAAIGREIRAAIAIAAAGAGGAKVTFVDTGGTREGAARAVSEAITRHRAAVAIGPVGVGEARAAARRAAAGGLPIALLSPAVAGAAPSAGVFRLWTSPAWEGRQAARVADELRYRRVAVLAPRDAGGAAKARAFREAAERRGIEVVRTGEYDPTATALEPDLKRFLGLDPTENARLRRHLRREGKEGWKTFTPELPFDLLYLPDRHDRAALVASYLPYFNVEVRTSEFVNVEALRDKYGQVPSVVQLLGSSGWRHPSLIARGGDAVQGALVVAACTGDSGVPGAGVPFATRFENETGHPPGAVAAQAFDAARLVLDARRYAIAQGPEDVRAEIARALSRMELEHGVCGPLRVDDRGELRRRATVLKVEGRQLVVYDR